LRPLSFLVRRDRFAASKTCSHARRPGCRPRPPRGSRRLLIARTTRNCECFCSASACLPYIHNLLLIARRSASLSPVRANPCNSSARMRGPAQTPARYPRPLSYLKQRPIPAPQVTPALSTAPNSESECGSNAGRFPPRRSCVFLSAAVIVAARLEFFQRNTSLAARPAIDVILAC